MKIFIAGASGLVGSSIYSMLKKKIPDAKFLIPSSSKLNLISQIQTDTYIKKNIPDLIILAAARVGGIMANDFDHSRFIYENIMINSNTIHSAYKNNIKKLIFFGSSCVYPKKNKIPIKEKYLLSGKLEKTNESYAIAKIAGIKLCHSYRNQYGCDFRSIMPTNLYGVNDNFDDQSSHVIPGIIQRIHKAKINNQNKVEIWGTGKPKRDFLHVDDLANATYKIIFASKKKYETCSESEFNIINVGSGKEITIKKLANIIKNVVGYEGELIFNPLKKDGTFRKIVDIENITKFNWRPKISLESGLKDLYLKIEKKFEQKM